MMLQGMTAQYLLKRTYKVQPGDTILIHAAAGGVGLIACQWAKALGATVIGTVGSDEKAALAKAHGCDHAIVYTRENFHRAREGDHRRRAAAGGVRLDRQGYLRRLARLPAPDGHDGELRQRLRSGAAASTSSMLASRGSLFFTRPSLVHYTAKREDLVASGEGPVRHRAVGQGEDRGAPALRAQGRGAGAPRSGSAQDHRFDDTAALGFDDSWVGAFGAK